MLEALALITFFYDRIVQQGCVKLLYVCFLTVHGIKLSAHAGGSRK